MLRRSAAFITEIPGVRAGWDPAPISAGHLPRRLWRDGRVHAFDEQGGLATSVAVAVPPHATLLAATPTLSVAVFGLPAATLIAHVADGRTVTAPITGPDRAVVLPSGRVLVTARIQADRRGAHRAHLVADDSRVLHAVDLPTADAGIIAVPHPHDGLVLLDAGHGQEGSLVFAVEEVDDRLVATQVLEDVVPTCFDSTGSRLLVTPHPSYGGPVMLLGWPGLDVLASLEPDHPALIRDTTDDPDDDSDDLPGFEAYGSFLGDDLVLLTLEAGGLLACGPELTPLYQVDIGPYTDEDLEGCAMFSLGPATFATDVWRDGAAHMTVWRMPDAADS